MMITIRSVLYLLLVSDLAQTNSRLDPKEGLLEK